ncbi:putative peptide maturation dehydrogenase [Bergeyella zoohelcum]|uniref:putative peptide maturation dehydrogenase n=1 Tax=Bergeyella zoohelcum TaxID=1015 RepID=UPI003735F7F6
MSLLKRTKYIFFFFRNFPTLNLESIIEKKLEFDEEIIAIPILYGKEVKISKEEFEFLISIKENEWAFYDDINHDFLNKFLEIGLIFDKDSEKSQAFIEKENILIEQQWHIYSALFSSMTKWRDIDVKFKIDSTKMDSAEDMKKTIEENGYPPLFYHKVESYIDKVKINYPNLKEDPFFDILLQRKTTRNFDKKLKLSFEKLSTILKYTFGVHGIRSLYESNIQSVKKTSPSGGGLHSTEVYILVMRVEGLECGLYHYNVNDDNLYLIKKYTEEEAIKKAYQFTAGQEYCTDSSVLFFMSHRFYRNYWKYRKNTAAYSVLLREAGHLSQNIYLIATKLDLGVFTAAINHYNIEEELGLKAFEQGITAMVGIGVKDENPPLRIEPIFEEFVADDTDTI